MKRASRDLGLLLLRLTTGWVLVNHGWGKLVELERFTGLLADRYPMHEVLGPAAALSEFVGGTLLILGLLTPVAAFFASATMATAAFYHHIGGHWPDDAALGFLEKLQRSGWEFALAMLGACLCLLLLGAGRWSLDGWMLARLRRRREIPATEGPAPAGPGTSET